MRILTERKSSELYAYPLVEGDLETIKDAGKLELIVYEPFGNSGWDFEGTSTHASCVNCKDRPCIYYTVDEINPTALEGMPYNNSKLVCPTNAINLSSTLAPSINLESCISCGLCLSRCDYGAIQLYGKKASVYDEVPTAFFEVAPYQESKYLNRERLFLLTPKTINLSMVSKDIIQSFYSSIELFIKRNNSFENLLVRNLFIQLGIESKVRAVGNNDIRIDLLGEQGDKILVAEIDLNGNDLLDLTRAILDDVAVVHSRYGISRERIVPIIVINTFPNKRSDFYEVISDIKNITGIEIKTISLHFLFMLQLFRQKLDLQSVNGLFYASKDNPSISDDCMAYFPQIDTVDPYFDSSYYSAIK